jgi:hypothetical protein
MPNPRISMVRTLLSGTTDKFESRKLKKLMHELVLG